MRLCDPQSMGFRGKKGGSKETTALRSTDPAMLLICWGLWSPSSIFGGFQMPCGASLTPSAWGPHRETHMAAILDPTPLRGPPLRGSPTQAPAGLIWPSPGVGWGEGPKPGWEIMHCRLPNQKHSPSNGWIRQFYDWFQLKICYYLIKMYY